MKLFTAVPDSIAIEDALNEQTGAAQFWLRALSEWSPPGNPSQIHIQGLTEVAGARIMVVFGSDLVRGLFMDPGSYSSTLIPAPAEGKLLSPVSQTMRDMFIFSDGSAAAEQRQIAVRALRGKRLNTPEQRASMQRRVDAALDRIGNAPIDFVEGVTIPYTFDVISDLFGMPDGRRAAVRTHLAPVAAAILNPLSKDVRKIAQPHVAALTEQLREVVLETKDDPTFLMAALLNATGEDKPFRTIEDLDAAMMLILAAGHETTANFLGNSVRGLINNHPDQLALLMQNRDDPKFVDSAMEELLRFYGPVQVVARVLTEDREIEGRLFKAGELFFVANSAVAFDPERVPSPDQLILGRHMPDVISHLGKSESSYPFGLGVHQCVGAELAKREAQMLLLGLFDRFPNLQIADAGVRRPTDFVVAGFSGLTVTGGPPKDPVDVSGKGPQVIDLGGARANLERPLN